ncbi:MAG: hypothetical protein KKE20_05950 [Nanoarchaeota archaeon]|nr:hypothetical protein [Nanoarchaeota archaeon]
MSSDKNDQSSKILYVSSLKACFDRLGSLNGSDDVKQLSALLGIYLAQNQHDSGAAALKINANSGLPSVDSWARLLSEAQSSENAPYLINQDFIVSFLKDALRGSSTEHLDHRRKNFYKSEIRSLSEDIRRLSVYSANISYTERDISLFFMTRNDILKERDGFWVSYHSAFGSSINDRIKEVIDQLEVSKVFSTENLLSYLDDKIGIRPVMAEELVIGPFAYHGLSSVSLFSELCSNAPGSFALQCERTLLNSRDDSTGYNKHSEKMLFCNKYVQERAIMLTNHYSIHLVGEDHGKMLN